MSDASKLDEPLPSADGKKLVNDLTVADARHLLSTEGGALDASRLVVRGVSIAVVAAACAYAIWAGHATVWHLALPMAGEYLVLLLAVPVLYLVWRHPAMQKDAVGSVRLLAILAIAGVFGSMLLAGYLHVSVMAGVAIAAYSLSFLLLGRGRGRIVKLLLVAPAFAWGIAIAALPLLLTINFLPHTERAELTFEGFSSYSMTGGDVPLLLAPYSMTTYRGS